jgi:hypothetical protein
LAAVNASAGRNDAVLLQQGSTHPLPVAARLLVSQARLTVAERDQRGEVVHNDLDPETLGNRAEDGIVSAT